jgi:hypothetical protein
MDEKRAKQADEVMSDPVGHHDWVDGQFEQPEFGQGETRVAFSLSNSLRLVALAESFLDRDQAAVAVRMFGHERHDAALLVEFRRAFNLDDVNEATDLANEVLEALEDLVVATVEALPSSVDLRAPDIEEPHDADLG